jgi:tRNA threonylcarbamoyladenosine biosynthesis protein TsaB
VKILSLDTSTAVFSIAVSDGDNVIAELSGDAGPAASARIPGHIQSLLRDACLDIKAVDAFAVTVGPGAFTGLRVGIALVKGLAYSTGKPVIPFSSLELLALNAKNSVIPVCTMFDARRGEVYSALYRFDGDMHLIHPGKAIAPAQLLAEMEGDVLFIGDGANRYRDLIIERCCDHAHFAADELNFPKASAGAALVQRRLESGLTVSPLELAPCYLRLPEAQLNKKRSACGAC